MKRWLWLLVLPCVVAAAILLTDRPWEERPSVPVSAPVPTHDIHVEVLNGCGEKGIAGVLGTRLRELGFDVITVDNAESYNYPETLVIDRVGRPDYARQVAEAIGVSNTIQQVIPDPFRIEEVTVIIGDDHRRLGIVADSGKTVTR